MHGRLGIVNIETHTHCSHVYQFSSPKYLRDKSIPTTKHILLSVTVSIKKTDKLQIVVVLERKGCVLLVIRITIIFCIDM